MVYLLRSGLSIQCRSHCSSSFSGPFALSARFKRNCKRGKLSAPASGRRSSWTDSSSPSWPSKNKKKILKQKKRGKDSSCLYKNQAHCFF